MKSKGISSGAVSGHIKDEQKDHDTYAKESKAAAAKGDHSTAYTLNKIAKEEKGHKDILQNLQNERPLNQPGDSGMRGHAQESMAASAVKGTDFEK